MLIRTSKIPAFGTQKPRQWGPISDVFSSVISNVERLDIHSANFAYLFPCMEGAGQTFNDATSKIVPTLGYHDANPPTWRRDRLFLYQTGHGGRCAGALLPDAVNWSTNKAYTTVIKFNLTDNMAYNSSGYYHYILDSSGGNGGGGLAIRYDTVAGKISVRFGDTAGFYRYVIFDECVVGKEYIIVAAIDIRNDTLNVRLNGESAAVIGNGLREVGTYYTSQVLGFRGDYDPTRYYGMRGEIDFLWAAVGVADVDYLARLLQETPYLLFQPVHKALYLEFGESAPQTRSLVASCTETSVTSEAVLLPDPVKTISFSALSSAVTSTSIPTLGTLRSFKAGYSVGDNLVSNGTFDLWEDWSLFNDAEITDGRLRFDKFLAAARQYYVAYPPYQYEITIDAWIGGGNATIVDPSVPGWMDADGHYVLISREATDTQGIFRIQCNSAGIQSFDNLEVRQITWRTQGVSETSVATLSLDATQTLIASASESSQTTDVTLDKTISLTGSATASSVTSEAVITQVGQVAFSASALSESVSSNVTLSKEISLTGNVSESTVTSEVVLSKVVELWPSSTAQSLLGTASLQVERALSSAISESSATSSSLLSLERALFTAASAQSETSTATLSITGEISFAATSTAVSATTEVTLGLTRALIASGSAQSVTSAASLVTTAAVAFVASCPAVSSTTAVSLDRTIALTALVSASTVTSEASLSIGVSLTASCLVESVTSQALLARIFEFTSSAFAASVTSEAGLLIEHSLTASASAGSQTSTAGLSVSSDILISALALVDSETSTAQLTKDIPLTANVLSASVTSIAALGKDLKYVANTSESSQTSTAALEIINYLVASSTAVSETTSVALTRSISLVGQATETSETSVVYLHLYWVFWLKASAAESTETSVAQTWEIILEALTKAWTKTSFVSLTKITKLIASATVTSVTSDAVIEKYNYLVASTGAITETSDDVGTTIVRSLKARAPPYDYYLTNHNYSKTSLIRVGYRSDGWMVSRLFWASLTAQSETSIIEMVIRELGDVEDTDLESLTTKRSFTTSIVTRGMTTSRVTRDILYQSTRRDIKAA